ncbi:hypothetical protein BLOT_004589 [Blomia tropicalis]|nr:hypothetical protein BLOT_004589 [Blomia tropicalis]
MPNDMTEERQQDRIVYLIMGNLRISLNCGIQNSCLTKNDKVDEKGSSSLPPSIDRDLNCCIILENFVNY